MGWRTKTAVSYGGDGCGFRVLCKTGTYRYLRTASGYPLMLTDCMEDYPVSLSVSGNTVQDGTPTPDSPVEVQGVGERTGNLLNVTTDTVEQGGITDADGIPIVNSARVRTKDFLTFEAGSYCISTNNSNIVIRTVYLFDYDTETFTSNAGGVGGASTRTFTLAEKTKVKFVFQKVNNTDAITVDEVVNAEIMLNKGDTSLPYEPYGYKVPLTQSAEVESTYNLYTDGELFSRKSINLADIANVSRSSNLTLPYPDRYDDYYILIHDYNYSYIPAKIEAGKTYYVKFDVEWLSESQVDIKTFLPNTGQYFMRNQTSFSFTANTDAASFGIYIDTTTLGIRLKVSNLMLVEGEYAVDEMPAYEPYGAQIPDTAVYSPTSKTAAVTRHSKVVDGEVVYASKTVTDISSLQDWDSIPVLSKGTNVITVGTEVEPSGMTAAWMSETPGRAVLGQMILGVSLLN